MKTFNNKLQVSVCWLDKPHTILHFKLTGLKGARRGDFHVRLDDLLSELSRLGVWEQLGIPVKGNEKGQ